MGSLNLDDWLGWNASSFMPSDPAAPYLPPDEDARGQVPSSAVADRLARKGLSASSPKAAAFDDGVDDWIFPTADPAVPYFAAGAGAQQQPPSSAVADRLARKGLTASPKAAALDDGLDDWIVPPAQGPDAAARAGTSAGEAVDRLSRDADGGVDDWIYPHAQRAETAGPAATAGSSAVDRIYSADGGPDDWIYPQTPAPQSDSGIAAPIMQRAWEGAVHGFGTEPLGFSQENRQKYPQTYRTWQPFVAPLDAAVRLPGGAIGAGAGLVGGAYQAFGGNEAESRRLERDVNLLGQMALLAPGLEPAFAPRGSIGASRRDGAAGRAAHPAPAGGPIESSPAEPRYTVSARSPSLLGTEIDVSRELFDGLRLRPARFYANYEALSRKHPEYLKDAQAAKFHVEQVLSSPEIAIPQRSGNVDLIARSPSGDKLIGFKAELRNNRYNISTAYVLTDGQFERMKEGAVRAGATILELNSRGH